MYRTMQSLLYSLLFISVPCALALSSISLDALRGKNILVVGGSGRVGGSCVTQLVKRGSRVTVGGTSLENLNKSKQRWQKLFPQQASAFAVQPEYHSSLFDDDSSRNSDNVKFCKIDRENASIVKAALENKKFDLVIHTAGPFQGKVNAPNGVLEACVDMGIPYIDVCDDYCTAKAAQTKYSGRAKAPCIISTGCWPGVSSLMALQLIDAIEKQQKDQNKSDLIPEDLTVDFSFFTAGSGGAGVTLLVATFLILSEPALMIKQGRRKSVAPMQEYTKVDFGTQVGPRDVAPLNLLETASIADNLNVGNVQALFGTAPDIWNALLGVMAKLPPSLLANEEIMRGLSIFSMPIVRAVDALAGATNAMRCDVTYIDKSNNNQRTKATALYAHENLEPCVGECVAAFASAVLTPKAVPPGVWFPEQAIKPGMDAAAVLGAAGIGAHTLEASSLSSNLKVSTEQVWGTRTTITSKIASKATTKV